MDCLHNPLGTGESAKIWRADDLGDIELLHARYRTYTFAKHMHEGAAFGIIEAGVETFYYQGAQHAAPAGHVIVFNPGEAHTGEAADTGGWRFRMFYLDAGLLKRAVQDMSEKAADIPFFPEPIIHDAQTVLMLRNLLISLEEGGSLLERESRFLWTLAQFAKLHADSPARERAAGDERGVVRLVRDYLEGHYRSNVSLEEIVALSGLSAYHLIRVFRQQVGLPPHAYLQQVRVNKARRLLRKGRSIIDVALMTGFTDQSHFTRHFKKMTGVTPGQYQNTAITYKTSSL